MNKQFIESTTLVDKQIFSAELFETNIFSIYHDKNREQVIKEIKEWLATKQIVTSLSWFYFEKDEDRFEFLIIFGDYINNISFSESSYPFALALTKLK